jgi:hypothetical protein
MRGVASAACSFAAALGIALAGAPTAAGAPAAVCPNEAIRVEQGATGLPDCRAYELVTPDARVGQDTRPARAAAQGGAISYFTNHPAASATSSSFFYLAERGPQGWSSQNIGPQNESAAVFDGVCEQNVFFAPDLSSHILELGWFDAAEPALCKRPEQFVAGEPEPFRNVFLGGGPADSYRILNMPPVGVAPANARFQDASDDLGVVIFGEEAKLTAGAPSGYAYYVWSDGVVRPLTVLPNGTVAAGELVEAVGRTSVTRSGFAPIAGAVSSDGSRAFFYSGGGLYLRRYPARPQSPIAAGVCTDPELACSVRVDATQGPGANGTGTFWRATDDGSTVFFTATSKLTANATSASGKPDLYRYDATSGLLTDLTAHVGEAASVKGVVGVGGNGSYVYFVANGVLAPGATPGNCPGTSAAPGRCNLYVFHDGQISFIGTLSRPDQLVWQENGTPPTSPLEKAASIWANVSPNGRYLAFVSAEKLTGYDNTDVKVARADRQIFLYDAAANGGLGQLRCASCPLGKPTVNNLTLAAAGNYGFAGNASWMANAVFDDGSLLFGTPDPLLAADVNGTEDVYRFHDGVTELLSPGTEPISARFVAASRDGTDIFLRTGQALVGADRDQGNLNLYDARIGGGFAEPAPAPAPCEGEDCRPANVLAPAPLVPVTGQARNKEKPPCRRAKRRRGCRKGAAKGSERRDGHRKQHHGKHRKERG